MTNRFDYMNLHCGDRVFRPDDPRHVGRVEAIISNEVTVRWENGWKEFVARDEIQIEPRAPRVETGALYTFRTEGDGYRCLKVDTDFNPLPGYQITASGKRYECSCPATVYPCRHLRMLLIFHEKKAVDGDKYYSFDHEVWVRGNIGERNEPTLRRNNRRYKGR